MSNESKKHHFVPRSLLKNFYNEEGRLFVFDKDSNKIFSSTVENAGHENYFNTIELAGTKINFEKFYDEIDSKQAILFKKIIPFEDEWELTDAEKIDLAYFTLVQLYRTKLSRTSIVEFSKELQIWMDDITKKTPFTPVNTKVSAEQSKIITLQQIDTIHEQIHHLSERNINIVRAPDNYTFYSSDNPVAMYNPYSYLKVGLGGVGTEICFPISKTILVNFTCSVTSKKIHTIYQDHIRRKIPIPESIDKLYKGLYLRKILEIEPKFVDFYNHLQVNTSSRFLYSAKNDFKVAKVLIEEAPELKNVTAKTTLGNKPRDRMPDGDYIVLSLKNKEHTMISVELLESHYDLHFKVSEKDSWKVAMLHDLKEPIEFVQTFKNKIECRFMRDVEIISFDRAQNIAVISHRDSGFNKLLEFMKEERLKRAKKK